MRPILTTFLVFQQVHRVPLFQHESSAFWSDLQPLVKIRTNQSKLTLRFFKGASSLLSTSKMLLLEVKLTTLWKGDWSPMLWLCSRGPDWKIVWLLFPCEWGEPASGRASWHRLRCSKLVLFALVMGEVRSEMILRLVALLSGLD